MGLSKLTDYAIVILTAMADSAHVHTASELARQTRIPLPTVSKVLKALKKGGLVQSQRGVTGGYALSRQPGDISVAEVIVAMEGPIGMTACSVRDGACALEAHCGAREAWSRLSHRIRGVLEEVSLQEFGRSSGTGAGIDRRPGVTR